MALKILPGGPTLGTTPKKKADPLAAVLKANASSRTKLAGMGAPDPTAKPDPSALDRLFGVLDAAGTGIRGLVHNVVDTKAPVDIFGEMGKSFRGEKRVEGADILGDLGVSNKWGKMLGGMAVDILLDPLTYLTAGMGGAGKSAVTSTLGAIGKGDKTLDAVLGVERAAKYADLLDESGHLADIATIPKDIAASLYDDVAKALGKTGGVKFAGIPITPDFTSGAGRTVKEVLRGQKGPQAWRDVAKPVSTWAEQAFVHDELTPLYREGNEVVKAFTTMVTRDRNAALHMADMTAEALQKKLVALVPDEKTRTVISKAIGKQFGDVGNMGALAGAFEAVGKSKTPETMQIASDALHTLRDSLFDPTAVERTLQEAGLQGDDLARAVDATAFVQKHFSDLLRQKREVGLEAKSLYGAGAGGESAGYVPGMDLSRPTKKGMRASEGITSDVFGAADVIAPDYQGAGFLGKMKPSTPHSKVYPNIEARRAGLTMEDIAAGVAPSTPGLRSEADIGVLLGSKARKDLRDVAYQKYVKDITGTLGESPELVETLQKAKAVFTNDDATRGFLKSTDKALNVWRKWATIYNFPMFPARNWISNKFLLSTEGILDPEAVGRAIQIAAKPDDAAKVMVRIGKETIDGQTLLDEARALRVYVGAPESMQLVGQKLTSKLDTVLGDVNQRFVEDADRLSGYIAARRKGLDPQAAAMLVDKALYSYAPEALTVFERNIMRRITPFYTFMRRNTPHMAELLATKPGSLTWISHAKESGEAATGIDTSILPGYTKNLFPIPIPTSDKNPMLLSTAGILPIGDLERVLPMQAPTEFAREQLSSLNPFVRDLLIEFPLNQDIYRAGPIESYAGEKRRMPEYVEKFTDLVDGIPVLGDMWAKALSTMGVQEQKTAAGDVYLAGNAYAVKAINDFVPWMNSVNRAVSDNKSGLITQLSGVKMIPYDQQSFQSQKAYTDRDLFTQEMNRLRDAGQKPAPKKKANPLTALLGGGK